MEPSFLTDMLAPVKTLTTTNSTSPPAFSSASRKTHFFREKSEGNTSAFFSHQPTRSSAFYKQRLCDVHASAHASPPLQEPLKVETRSTAFKILPPRLPITYFIDSIEIPPHQGIDCTAALPASEHASFLVRETLLTKHYVTYSEPGRGVLHQPIGVRDSVHLSAHRTRG